MKLTCIVLLSIAVLLTVAPSADAWPGYWEFVGVVYIPDDDTAGDTCSGGDAYLICSSTGGMCTGNGYADDESWNCDVLAVAVASGLSSESWTWIGLMEGRARVNAITYINGVANLVDADCAAAALGYAEYYSNVSGTTYAALTHSAGQTGANQLGEVSAAYEGFGPTIYVTIGTGEGSYPDEEINEITAQECTNFFYKRHRTKSYLKVWANDTWPGSAECDVDLTGTVVSTYVLDACPCPPAVKG